MGCYPRIRISERNCQAIYCLEIIWSCFPIPSLPTLLFPPSYFRQPGWLKALIRVKPRPCPTLPTTFSMLNVEMLHLLLPLRGPGLQEASWYLRNYLRSFTWIQKLQLLGTFGVSLAIQPRCMAAVFGSPLLGTDWHWLRAITGFVMALTPLCFCLMGWRGAGNNGAAHMWVIGTSLSSYSGVHTNRYSSSGAYIFFGGILLLVGGLLECIIGNTFSSVVFMSFGKWYCGHGCFQVCGTNC